MKKNGIMFLFMIAFINNYAQKQILILDNQQKISVERVSFSNEIIKKITTDKIIFSAFVDGCGKANEIPISRINRFVRKMKIRPINTSYYIHQGETKFYIQTDHYQQKYGKGFQNLVKIRATLYKVFTKTSNHQFIIINEITPLEK